MKKRLVTSALPYVNNIPHLGNLIQVLSADAFARFCRARGYETLYVCGTDEYGTATETRALAEGVTPRELCDRYYEIHTEIYRWFNIAFDKWGRTSTPQQTEIAQHIFRKLYDNGYISSKTIRQLYSEQSEMFLADRYVRGTCPHCGYDDARGDQCENCGKLLDPADLIDPRSILDDSKPVLRETKHLYIDLPALRPTLEAWMKTASVEGFWARNALQMTQAWIRDGLKERSVTRDLKWGIPVPVDGYRDKVLYVWFDAPIGYISITATYTDRWEAWWRNPDEVELYQFIGKDNIPFHTVIFPGSLLGTGERWTLLHHMSSTEYLNYESGKFSKSKGIGVFGNDVRDTGIPADVWRFYIFYNRPESSDYTFTWADFMEKVNGELIGNLGNLVNRTLSFYRRFFGDEVGTPAEVEPASLSAFDATAYWDEAHQLESAITDHFEHARLRDALRGIFALSSVANRAFQAAEPWKTRKTDEASTRAMLVHFIYTIRDIAVLIRPFIPATADRIAGFLGLEPESLTWDHLGRLSGIERIADAQILFEQLEGDRIEALRARFSGSQEERAAAIARHAAENGTTRDRADEHRETRTKEKTMTQTDDTNAAKEPTDERPIEQRFAETVELRVARITAVERHPEADKLYVEQIDDGSGEPRTIVSGLVPHYAAEELEGHNIILVDNLKPAKLRGVKSQGMLLAASKKLDEPDPEGRTEIVDVVFADDAAPGTRVVAEGIAVDEAAHLPRISADRFFAIPLEARGGVCYAGAARLMCGGTPLTTRKVSDGGLG